MGEVRQKRQVKKITSELAESAEEKINIESRSQETEARIKVKFSSALFLNSSLF